MQATIGSTECGLTSIEGISTCSFRAKPVFLRSRDCCLSFSSCGVRPELLLRPRHAPSCGSAFAAASPCRNTTIHYVQGLLGMPFLQGMMPLVGCTELYSTTNCSSSKAKPQLGRRHTCRMTSSSSSEMVTTSGVAPWLRPFSTPASAASVDASRSPILNFTLMPELCARNVSDQLCAVQQGPRTEHCLPPYCPGKTGEAGGAGQGMKH